MRWLSELKDIEIIGTDGNLMGWLRGFTFANIGDWRVTSVAVKLEKESHEELGVKKPMMSSALVDIPVDTVKKVSDNMILNQPQRAMKPHLKAHVEAKNIVNMLNKPVIDSDGKDLGVISDVMLDTDGWRFPSILIKLDKEVLEHLRMDKCPDCERSVLLPMGNVSTIGDNVMLSITKDVMGTLVQNVSVKTM